MLKAAFRLHALNPMISCTFRIGGGASYSPRLLGLHVNNRRQFASFNVRSVEFASSVPSDTHSTVGSSAAFQTYELTLSHRHIDALSFIAFAVAVSATWLICSTIPAILAFKRAAESLEKQVDVMREELPDTMAAVRISGMEISELTGVLSDLGQEMTQGVRSSTRVVHIAEERLRQLINIIPIAGGGPKRNQDT